MSVGTRKQYHHMTCQDEISLETSNHIETEKDWKFLKFLTALPDRFMISHNVQLTIFIKPGKR